jgi:hypothetical protein
MNNNIIYNEMIEKQLLNINDNKLSSADIMRISNKLTESIFSNNCVIYNGTYYKKNNNYYIPFYYNYKKISLTRILFINYIESINSNVNIKYTCNNKGLCCCLNHMTLSKRNNNNDNHNINININNIIVTF